MNKLIASIAVGALFTTSAIAGTGASATKTVTTKAGDTKATTTVTTKLTPVSKKGVRHARVKKHHHRTAHKMAMKKAASTRSTAKKTQR